jgi:hypothetical protein
LAATLVRAALFGLTLVVAQAQIFYNADFESTRHVVGSPPALGAPEGPANLGIGLAPTIVSVGGSKKLRFEGPGRDFSPYRTAEFVLGYHAPFYHFEFDLSFVGMPEWDGVNPNFTLLFDTPTIENLEFKRVNGTIVGQLRVVPFGSIFGTVVPLPPLPSTSNLHCVLDIDPVRGQWTITMNGQRMHQGPFRSDTGDITNMRVSASSANLTRPGETVVDLDNVLISGGEARERTRAVNLSVRAVSGAGENGLIIGFVVTGGASRDLLVRAAGPALVPFGITSVLTDPRLTMNNSSGAAIASNDDWSETGSQATSSLFASAGAFSFAAGSKDAALRAFARPGAYTVQIAGATAAEGMVIGELYDLSSADGGIGRLGNVSARGNVNAQGASLIIGLVVNGPGTQRFLFRAVGPALQALGVATAAESPRLSVRRADGTEITANERWGGTAALATLFTQVGAFPLDAASRDAAVAVDLAAGTYTVVIDAAAGTRAGVVLAEAYEAP